MSTPFIGEIRMFAGNFAPAGWAFCHGQLMAISENDALFTLIGTTYGGDGQTTFALPNLQSRLPVHQGTGPQGITYMIGEASGVETVTLTVNQIPAHSHPPLCNSAPATSAVPNGNFWAASSALNQFTGQAPNANTAGISPTGGSQPHDNMHPYLTVNFIISLFGIFPSQT